MTREEAIAALIGAKGEGECPGHHVGDCVLCDLLVSLGYEDVVKAWHEIPKWYE